LHSKELYTGLLKYYLGPFARVNPDIDHEDEDEDEGDNEPKIYPYSSPNSTKK
jgi:hypothetical protein